MTVGTAPGRVDAGAGQARGPVRLAVRLVRRGTVVVTVVAGVLPAVVAAQYRDTFGGAVGVESLAVLADNPAIRTLFGPALALDDPGGFTVWRTGTVLAVLVGTWAALTGTRLTRGEEEAGRWDLLLAGPLAVSALLARQLGVLLAAATLPGLAAGAGLLLAGTSVAGAVLFGVLLAGTGAAGAAVGALAGQLLPERRAASGLAVAVVLGGLLLRMVGDGVPSLSPVQWLTPVGLLSRAAPFSADSPVPVAVIAVLVALPAVAAVRLAGRRDVGGALLRGRDVAPRPSRLVRSLPGLAAHRTRRPVGTWGAGLSAYFLLIGLLATSLTDFLRANPRFAELAAQAGFARLGTVQGYVAALLSLLAVPVGAFAAARVAATAADETSGRLALLYALPVTRWRWALVEGTAVGLGCVVLAVLAGLATWAGTAWVGAGLAPGEALAGALAVVPIALLCLAAAVAALGWLPQAVLAVGVLPGAGGYLLLVLADTFGWPGWVRWFSPFDHLASVPAEPMDVGGALGMLAVAAALVVVGLAGYSRRDLR